MGKSFCVKRPGSKSGSAAMPQQVTLPVSAHFLIM